MVSNRPVATRDNNRLLGHVLRGAGSLYLSLIIQLTGRFVFAVIVARLAGASAVGIFTVGFIAVQTLVMVATSGVEVGLYHFVSPAIRNGDLAMVKGMFRASVSTTVMFAFVLAALYVMLVPFYPLAGSGVPEVKLALQLFAPALVLQVLVVVLGAFAMALGYPSVKALAERVVGTVMQLIAVVVMLALGAGLTGVVLAYLANLVAAAILALCLVWRVFPRQGQASPLWLSVKKLYTFSYKQGLARIIGYPLMNANLFLLGYLAGPIQVGIYAVASRLALVGILFLEAFGQMQATLVAGKERETYFKDNYQRVTKWIVIFSTPLFVLLSAFASAWMGFMGAEFVVGVPVLVILAFSQLVNMLTGSTGLILSVHGRPGLALLNTCLGWGTGAVLTLFWAANHGALGAAMAYFAAIVVIVVLEAAECRLVFGFYPLGRSILKPAVLVTLLALIALGLAYFYTWSFVVASGWSVLLLTAYIIAMWRFGLQPVDIEASKNMLGRRSSKS